MKCVRMQLSHIGLQAQAITSSIHCLVLFICDLRVLQVARTHVKAVADIAMVHFAIQNEDIYPSRSTYPLIGVKYSSKPYIVHANLSAAAHATRCRVNWLIIEKCVDDSYSN